MSVADLQKLVTRLEAVTGRLESVSVGGKGSSGGAVQDDDPEWMDEYNAFVLEQIAPFMEHSKGIGGDVLKHAVLVQAALDAHDTLLKVAARFNTPSPADMQELIKPLAKAISDVQNFRESNRPSKQINFLSAISEGIPFLGWVTIAPKPANYVLQMEESSQFYTNKILKEFRGNNEKLADWSKKWIILLKKFQTYVKDHHTIGLKWSKDKPPAVASSASTVSKSGGGVPPPPPAGGAPPPPPPGGMPPPPSGAPVKPKAAAPDTSALFSALNKGSGVTSGLKKVSDDQKTHKNPALRSQAPVPAKSNALAPRPFKKVSPSGAKPVVAKKQPVFELQGDKKWVVEHQEGNQSLVIADGESNQCVYMYKCTNSVLQIKSKLNSITLDSCKKCIVVFEDLISTCEFVNCQSVKAQANGSVPTISIDKTDGAQIYVNDKSIKSQIITAKSSEMNICISQPDGDVKEYPLAEQFITVWDGKQFTTNTMDLNL